MADEVSVSKLAGYAATGAADAVSVSKLVAYILLEPSAVEVSDDTIRQSSVTSYVVTKPTR